MKCDRRYSEIIKNELDDIKNITKNVKELDFLYDDFDSLSVVPLEVKSGKDYKRHVAVSRFVSNKEYGIKEGFVLSNSGVVEKLGKITYVPVYFSLFFDNRLSSKGPVLI